MEKALCLLVFVIFTSCSKNNPNPFENETELDSRNLKVRKVILTESADSAVSKIFKVTIENTCKLCDESKFNVYDQFFMINLETNDTIGRHDKFDLSPPKNKNVKEYELNAAIDSEPDYSRVKFDLSFTGIDIPYEPN